VKKLFFSGTAGAAMTAGAGATATGGLCSTLCKFSDEVTDRKKAAPPEAALESNEPCEEDRDILFLKSSTPPVATSGPNKPLDE